MIFIKHKLMKDVCCQVLDKLETFKYRVRWWNIAMGDPFPIGRGHQFVDQIIHIKDPENWSDFDIRATKTRA